MNPEFREAGDPSKIKVSLMVLFISPLQSFDFGDGICKKKKVRMQPKKIHTSQANPDIQ